MSVTNNSIEVLAELVHRAAKDGDGYLIRWLLLQAYTMLQDGPKAVYAGIACGDILTYSDVYAMLGCSTGCASNYVGMLLSVGLIERTPIIQEGRRYWLLSPVALAPTRHDVQALDDMAITDTWG